MHGISIKVTGHIEGEAKIILMSGGKPYRTESLTGKVKVRWDGERVKIIYLNFLYQTAKSLLIFFSSLLISLASAN